MTWTTIAAGVALDLGLAWQEAEAALPEGWPEFSISKSADAWYAMAAPIPMDEWDERGVTAMGVTPAAALRALAERLRSQR